MADTATGTTTTPAAPASTTPASGSAPSPAAVSPTTPDATPSTPEAKKSFGAMMESTLKDLGQEMVLDDMGRLTVQPLAKTETIDGHSVEDLEKIAAGDRADDQPPTTPTPSTVQPLSQPPTTQSTDEVAALRQQVALLTQHILDQRQNGSAQPPSTPPTPSMRDVVAKQLEDAGYDAGMADIFMALWFLP